MTSGVPAGQHLKLNLADPNALSTTNFTALGPQPERMTGCSGCFDYTTTEGRVNAIAVDPTTTVNGSIVAYIGAVGGGVWKTTNCCSDTTTWTVVTDDPLISTTAIDTVVIDPSDHNTIYAGTGDLNFGSFSMGSQGILKSTDAGATWTVLGADVFGMIYTEPPGQFPQYNAVGKVRVDPNNSSNVVAGTKQGLYFSYDGGTNWDGPCFTNNFSTQRQDVTGLELSDMGGGTTRIIAAIGTRGFPTTVQYDLGKNGANGLYSATMGSSGCPSFTSIASNANGFVFGNQVTGSPYTTGAPMNAGSGTPCDYPITGGTEPVVAAPISSDASTSQSRRVTPITSTRRRNPSFGITTAVAVTPMVASSAPGLRQTAARTGLIWRGLKAARSETAGPAIIRRTGTTRESLWTRIIQTASSSTRLTCGLQRARELCGTISPAVIPGGSPRPVHVDQHALAFVPGSSSILAIGNDGGVHGTTNADIATRHRDPTWFNMDTGINTIEFYSGDISGNFANAASPQANGGSQDNGSSSVTFIGHANGACAMATGGWR